MRIPAQELLPIEIESIVRGLVNAQVNARVLPGAEICITITLESLQELGLQLGSRAYAVIEESNNPLLINNNTKESP